MAKSVYRVVKELLTFPVSDTSEFKVAATTKDGGEARVGIRLFINTDKYVGPSRFDGCTLPNSMIRPLAVALAEYAISNRL